MSKIDNYKQYTQVSYSGTTLLKKHSLDEEGAWQVFGEDPNCDMGGPHHEPQIGIFTGKLKDIIKYAVNHPTFWSWGAGGRIVKLTIRDVTTMPEMEALIQRKAQLEKELAEINKKMGV